MGLDMYFYARKKTFQSYMRWDGEEGKQDLTNYPEDLSKMADYIFKRNFRWTDIATSYQIGYFRKFNALHSYIVNEYADGVNECQEIRLNRKDLGDMLKIFNEVLEDHSKAPELLPAQNGFFFGSTEYDDYFFSDVQEAKELFEMILENVSKDYDIIYKASW